MKNPVFSRILRILPLLGWIPQIAGALCFFFLFEIPAEPPRLRFYSELLLVLYFILAIPHLIKRNDSFLIVFSVLRFSLLLLFGIPLGESMGIEFLLFLALPTDLILLGGLRYLPIVAGETMVLFLLQGKHAVWNSIIPAVPLLHWFIYASLAVLYILILSLFRILILGYQRNEHKMNRLDFTVTQLTDTNIGFQSYLKNSEMETILTERKRMSRDIHDTVGYCLTNIIMLLQAASVSDEPDKMREIMSQAIHQAKHSLEETRGALRGLRKEEIPLSKGLSAINELISAFRKASGITITTEYTNLPYFTNSEIDAILFRIVQEGLTNALRHGMATRIKILLWSQQNWLRMVIHDNGGGSQEIKEGIGLSGMKERLSSVKGHLEATNTADGFELRVSIPWNKNKEVHEQKDQDPAG